MLEFTNSGFRYYSIFHSLLMQTRFAFVSLAIMLIAGIVAAIPESEVDRSDPYLFQKIINGTIVIDPPASHKRQSTTIATLCSGRNLGSCIYPLTTTSSSIPVIPTQNAVGVSSGQLYDRNYALVLYRYTNFAGETRVFRTTFPINNMADQGDFEDLTGSAKIVYLGSLFYGVNLWEGSDYSLRVSYVVPGTYVIMDNSGASVCTIEGCANSLSIRGDKLSSFEVMPGIKLELWRHSGLSGTYGGPFPPYSLTYSYYCPNMNNCASNLGHDSVSSFKVTVW